MERQPFRQREREDKVSIKTICFPPRKASSSLEKEGKQRVRFSAMLWNHPRKRVWFIAVFVLGKGSLPCYFYNYLATYFLPTQCPRTLVQLPSTLCCPSGTSKTFLRGGGLSRSTRNQTPRNEPVFSCHLQTLAEALRRRNVTTMSAWSQKSAPEGGHCRGGLDKRPSHSWERFTIPGQRPHLTLGSKQES